MAPEMTYVDIVNGPGKFDLATATFGHSNHNPSYVKFRVRDRKGQPRPDWWPSERALVMTVRIDSVQREDGSGESWNIEGYVMEITESGSDVILWKDLMLDIKFHYDMRTRKGTITLPSR